MSYYPVLKAPGCQGWVTLCNFSPNNWEIRDVSSKFINVTWAEGGKWRSEYLGMLAPDEMRTITIEEVSGVVHSNALPLLSLGTASLPTSSESLPQIASPQTHVPNWRATLGLSSAQSSTCYQGEIDPFPPSGSLLTFGPFIQFNEGVENYLILLNIEKSPIVRSSQVEILDADQVVLREKVEVVNNDATIIPLDNLGFGQNDLPVIVCRGMSAIPLYFSKTSDGSFLSLEHTHPPASYVIHGKRWEAQKVIKNLWFARTAQ